MGSTVFRNPRALSSALAALGTLQPRALGFLNTVDPLGTVSNCYLAGEFLAMSALSALLPLPMNGSHNASHNVSDHHGPLDNKYFFLASKVLVGVTSALSLCGGLLIAVSWFFSTCCRGRTSSNPAPRPTPPRNVLFNLSIADSLVAVSHLVGVSTDFRKHSDAGTLDYVCIVQGSLATYSTIASFLWTIVLTFLVTVTLTLNRSKTFGTMKAFVIYLIICWGLPLVLVCVFFAINQFGYDKDDNLCKCAW